MGRSPRTQGQNSPSGPLGRRSPERPLPQNPVELHFGADVQRVRVGMLQGRRRRHGVGLGCEHRVSKTLPWPGPLPSWDWKGQKGQWEAVGWGRRRGAYPGEPRGAGSLVSGWGEAPERRRLGGTPRGGQLRRRLAASPPSSPPVRAASILVAWIGWEWQVSRSVRPPAPIRAGADCRN